MGELSKAIIRSGVIDQRFLQEMAKWKLPQTIPDEPPFTTSDEVVAAIEEAQESANQVEIRVSDPDALKQFLKTKQPCRLVLKYEEQSAKFDWEYGTSPTGDYILQWGADIEADILCNGESYLWNGTSKVYFSRVQDLYFGDKRVFVLCTPRKSNGTTNSR